MWLYRSIGFVCVSYGFRSGFAWCSCGRVGRLVSYGFRIGFVWFSCGCIDRLVSYVSRTGFAVDSLGVVVVCRCRCIGRYSRCFRPEVPRMRQTSLGTVFPLKGPPPDVPRLAIQSASAHRPPQMRQTSLDTVFPLKGRSLGFVRVSYWTRLV